MTERLVLLNTSADLLTGVGSERLRARQQAEMRPGPEAMLDPPEDANPAARSAFDEQRQRLAALTAEQRQAIHQGWLRTFDAYQGIDLTSELHRLRMPALIVHGDQDDIVPPAGAFRMHAEMPHGPCVCYPAKAMDSPRARSHRRPASCCAGYSAKTTSRNRFWPVRLWNF